MDFEIASDSVMGVVFWLDSLEYLFNDDPTIKSDKDSYAIGESISIDFTGCFSSKDIIALDYARNSTYQEGLAWTYAGETSETKGTVSLRAPDKAGQYKIYYFDQSGKTMALIEIEVYNDIQNSSQMIADFEGTDPMEWKTDEPNYSEKTVDSTWAHTGNFSLKVSTDFRAGWGRLRIDMVRDENSDGVSFWIKTADKSLTFSVAAYPWSLSNAVNLGSYTVEANTEQQIKVAYNDSVLDSKTGMLLWLDFDGGNLQGTTFWIDSIAHTYPSVAETNQLQIIEDYEESEYVTDIKKPSDSTLTVSLDDQTAFSGNSSLCIDYNNANEFSLLIPYTTDKNYNGVGAWLYSSKAITCDIIMVDDSGETVLKQDYPIGMGSEAYVGGEYPEHNCYDNLSKVLKIVIHSESGAGVLNIDAVSQMRIAWMNLDRNEAGATEIIKLEYFGVPRKGRIAVFKENSTTAVKTYEGSSLYMNDGILSIKINNDIQPGNYEIALFSSGKTEACDRLTFKVKESPQPVESEKSGDPNAHNSLVNGKDKLNLILDMETYENNSNLFESWNYLAFTDTGAGVMSLDRTAQYTGYNTLKLDYDFSNLQPEDGVFRVSGELPVAVNGDKIVFWAKSDQDIDLILTLKDTDGYYIKLRTHVPKSDDGVLVSASLSQCIGGSAVYGKLDKEQMYLGFEVDYSNLSVSSLSDAKGTVYIDDIYSGYDKQVYVYLNELKDSGKNNGKIPMTGEASKVVVILMSCIISLSSLILIYKNKYKGDNR